MLMFVGTYSSYFVTNHCPSSLSALRAMSSLTFGSVGDIIAICGIIQQVVQALSDTRGSAPEYVIGR